MVRCRQKGILRKPSEKGEIKKVIEKYGVKAVAEVLEAFEREGFSLIKNPWSGDAKKMPEGTMRGLKKAQEISRKCSGVRGVARHPTKGHLIPMKNLCQMALQGKIKDEEVRKFFLSRLKTPPETRSPSESGH